MKSARVALMLALGGCEVAAAQGGACAPSPAAAIEAARRGAAWSGVAMTASTGYRVEAVRLDRAQGQRWALIRSCDHAERPTVAMLTDLPLLPANQPLSPAGQLLSVTALVADVVPGAAAVLAAGVLAAAVVANVTQPVVHAGDTVRLWRVDGMASIELAGTAEENGVAGARVRVRLIKPPQPDGQQAPPQRLTGVVRGPGDVEIQL